MGIGDVRHQRVEFPECHHRCCLEQQLTRQPYVVVCPWLCCVVLGNLKEGDYWEDIGMNGNIKLDIEDRLGQHGLDEMFEERDRLWASVCMLRNLQAP